MSNYKNVLLHFCMAEITEILRINLQIVVAAVVVIALVVVVCNLSFVVASAILVAINGGELHWWRRKVKSPASPLKSDLPQLLQLQRGSAACSSCS